MEIKEVENKDLLRKYSITVADKDLDAEIDKRANEAAKTISMDGFRQGKVPVAVVKMRFKDSLKAEAQENLLKSAVEDLIKKNDFKLATTPQMKLDDTGKKTGLSFTLEFELLPEVPKIDYSKIKLTNYECDVDEASINKSLEAIQKRSATFEALPEGSKAKINDVVLIDVLGSMDGKDFPEGKVDNKHLKLGSKEFIPGFEEGLVGAKAGDERTLDLTMPKDYWAKELAGKKVSFTVKVKEVLKDVLLPLDDEFAKKANMKDLKELRDKAKEVLEAQYKDISDTILRKELFDYFDEKVKFSLPTTLIANEQRALSESEKHPGDNKESDEHLAKRRVKLGILVAAIAEEEDIKVSQNDLKSSLEKKFAFSGLNPNDILNYYKNNPEALEHFKGKILEDNVVDFVKSKITLTKKKVTSDQLQKLFDEIK